MVEIRAFTMTLPILYMILGLGSSNFIINGTKPTVVERFGEARSAVWKYPEENSRPGRLTHHGARQYNDNNNYNQPDAVSAPGFPESLRPYPLAPYAVSTYGLNNSNSSTVYGDSHYPKSVQNVYYPIYVNDYNQKPNKGNPYFNPNPMRNPYPYPSPYPPKINPYPYPPKINPYPYPPKINPYPFPPKINPYLYQEPYYPNKGYPYAPNPQIETYTTNAYPNYPYPNVDSYYPPKGYPYYPEPAPYPYPQPKPFFYSNYGQNLKIGYGTQLGYVQALLSPDRGIKIDYIVNPLLCYGLGMSTCSGYILKEKQAGQPGPVSATATPFKTIKTLR